MIRQLNENDSVEIHQILSGVHNGGFGGQWNLSQVISEIRNGGGVGWTENPNGPLLAFILFRYTIDAVEITNLATHFRYQRRGAMRKLLSEWLAKWDAEKEIWLEVHERNIPARTLYEKLGFCETGRRPKYYPDGAACLLYTLKSESK